MKLFTILLSGILVNNFILVKFMGICPFLGVSKKLGTAVGMGAAVTFVMAIASAFTYLIQIYILEPLGLGYLQSVSFVLVIATLVQLVEMIVMKVSPSLYNALGVYLPLITTNCAVLGVAILNIQQQYNLLESVVNGVSSAIGFALAIILFAGVREKLALSEMPKWMEGFPGALITAGLISMAFLGFQGLV
jgi:electron transport complex protein RnfA